MGKKIIYILFVLGLSLNLHAQQYEVEGKVVDKNTHAVLPFVNMIVTGSPQNGATADIDGNFKIISLSPIHSLTFSYVGYHDAIITLKDTARVIKNLTIRLEEEAYHLNEVLVLPGVNPALRIIRQAIDNRDRNNPEKVRSFTYVSYNKMYCTSDLKAHSDSINSLDSTILKKPKADTAKQKTLDKRPISEILKNQYLFLLESVSERRYLYPDHNHEQIIASRTSGLKDSPFALLATQMQSFSFYTDHISILGHDYMNPISPGGLKRYNYIIQDTLYNGKDTVFVISFHPRKDKNFSGMKGVLYINNNGYAIQNVLAQPLNEHGTVTIHIQQKYEFIKNTQWFPIQLNTDWVYNNTVVNDSVAVIGPGGGDTSHRRNPDDDYNKLKIVTRSYIRDIVLDTTLRKRDFGRVEVEFAKNASSQSDTLWNKYRIDTLSRKEKNTYHVIDSLGHAEHFDQKLKWFETLSSGKLKWGVTDIDLNKILNYNGYEKFRLGFGLHTNDEISKFVSVGGYGAYGTNDQAFKYGGDIGFLFNPYSHLKLDFAYKNDVIESGGINFYNDDHFLSTEAYHDYFVNNMDKIEEKQASLSFDALQYFQFNLFGDQQTRTVTNGYEFGVNNNNVSFLSNQYQFTEVGLGIRFAYKEKFLKSPLGMISLGTKYPIVWANITKGLNGPLDGQYDYTKYDLKISKGFQIHQVGYSAIEVLGGCVNGNVPSTLLYNGRASFEQFTLAVDNSFETMRLNEFMSSRYVDIFYSHDFMSYLFHLKHFRPHVKIVSHAGWGSLDYPSTHYFYTFKTMDKGYYESGIELNNLIRSSFFRLGFGTYYRYGPYAFSNTSDNFAFKLTLVTVFE
ncbi:MAG TPA: DUF5686 family protein [Bacteroidia bacterium]|jgi:hypothetical protein|nr:DUF5686 family protein [Bacteroidia bacterium]